MLRKKKNWVGVLIRDHLGQFAGALRATRTLAQNSSSAESLAFLTAVKFCQDMEIQHCILEGDALQVVNLLLNQKRDWSEGGLLI